MWAAFGRPDARPLVQGCLPRRPRNDVARWHCTCHCACHPSSGVKSSASARLPLVRWFGDALARPCPAARFRHHGAGVGSNRCRERGGPRLLSADVRCAGSPYALVTVTGLTPDTVTEYDVKVDGELVWPLADRPSRPASSAPAGASTHRLQAIFGSCRYPKTAMRSSTPNSGSMLWTCTHPDGHAADRRLAGGADPARRPVVRRRAPPETTPGGPSPRMNRHGQRPWMRLRLRRIPTAVPPFVG